MDKTSNVQYSSNRLSPLKDGYKLTYKEAGNRLNLVDKDGSSIFDVSLDEVAEIYRARSFLEIKLKDKLVNLLQLQNLIHCDFQKMFVKYMLK